MSDKVNGSSAHSPTNEQQEEARQKLEDKMKGNPCMEALNMPRIDFSRFVISLAHQTLALLGEIPNPETNETERNLPLAKQTIDILEMLEEKTKGNLTGAEEKMIEQVLYDLRTHFVMVCK